MPQPVFGHQASWRARGDRKTGYGSQRGGGQEKSVICYACLCFLYLFVICVCLFVVVVVLCFLCFVLCVLCVVCVLDDLFSFFI